MKIILKDAISGEKVDAYSPREIRNNAMKNPQSIEAEIIAICNDLKIPLPALCTFTEPLVAPDGTLYWGVNVPKSGFIGPRSIDYLLIVVVPEMECPHFVSAVAAHEARHIYQRYNGMPVTGCSFIQSLADQNEVDADAYSMYWLMKRHGLKLGEAELIVNPELSDSSLMSIPILKAAHDLRLSRLTEWLLIHPVDNPPQAKPSSVLSRILNRIKYRED